MLLNDDPLRKNATTLVSQCAKEIVGKFNEGRKVPDNLVVFRDLVNDLDAFKHFEEEVASIRAELASAYGSCPKVCYVIVKRIYDERFVQVILDHYARHKNGLVIVNDLGIRQRFDFYIVTL